MKKLFAFLLIAINAFGVTLIHYDPASPGVSNQVKLIRRSVNDPLAQNSVGLLVLRTNEPLSRLPASDLKVVGTNLVLLTEQEKTLIAETNAVIKSQMAILFQQQAETDAKTNALNILTTLNSSELGRIFRAFAEDELKSENLLRSQIQLARTNFTAFQSATNRSSVNLNPRSRVDKLNAVRTELEAQEDHQ